METFRELDLICKPYKIYAEILEEGALNQFIGAMQLDCVVSGALMPDAHLGYTLPIGAVIAVDGFVFPAFVGYDIGCGMCALKLEGISKEDIISNDKEIFNLIYRDIPVGFNVNKTESSCSLEGTSVVGRDIAISKNYKRALGSLGGGNHFIEIGYDENDEIWVVIHSGSRGVGHAIATHYMQQAHPEGKAKEGYHGLPTSSEAGVNYILDLNWCLNYALMNRKEMMSRVVGAITEVLSISCYELDFSGIINRNHNHAALKDGLWIHRKGATHAEEGMNGVIPGNMRDGSFIVVGKGNPDSLYSSSHGAGRVLGRKEAKKELNVVDFEETMVGVCAKVCEKTLDESPCAYKDIFEVVGLQHELVEVKHYIKPLINIKG